MQRTRKIYELFSNGEPMDEPIAHHDRYTLRPNNIFPEVPFAVPEGNYFMLGDDRREPVFCSYWPLNRIGIRG